MRRPPARANGAAETSARWPVRRVASHRIRAPQAAAAAADAASPPAAAAAPAPPPPPPPPLAVARWLRARGAVVDPRLELVAQGARGRTLTATGAVKAGERLAIVPLRLCVTSSSSSSSSAAAAAEATEEEDASAPLRAVLRAMDGARRRPPGSGADPWGWQWRSAAALLHHALTAPSALLRDGYLPHLPGWSAAPAGGGTPPLPQLPLLWGDAELRELQGCLPGALPPPAASDAAAAAEEGGKRGKGEPETQAERRRRFAREFLLPVPAWRAALEREAGGGGGGAGGGGALDAAERLLAWALAVVTSRSFAISGGHAMVPLVDMADHLPEGQANAEVAALRADDGDVEGQQQPPADGGAATAVVLKAARDLAPGEAVTITYGRHAPADALLSYGFFSSGGSSSDGGDDGAAAAPGGPAFCPLWDGGALLLAAFDALVAGAGPGVADARDLPAWQRRALDALFSRSEADVLAGMATVEARAVAAAAAAAAKKTKKGGGGFGGGAKAAGGGGGAAAAAGTPATAVRLGGDRAHSADARLAGAARLLALSKQDAGVAAALKELLASPSSPDGGLAALCAPPMTGGGGAGAAAAYPISAAHEAVAARALAGYCALAYRRAFRTTIQEDERLLAATAAEREAAETAADAAAAAAAAPSATATAPSLLPPSLGLATPRDRLERRELALRYRLAAKRELVGVAQAAGAHMKQALAAC